MHKPDIPYGRSADRLRAALDRARRFLGYEPFTAVPALGTTLTDDRTALLAQALAGPTEDLRDHLVAAVIEESELLGFCLAWWRAGGFAGLEAAGWNRATIFRTLRRFRTTVGAHPDDDKPDWIKLNLVPDDRSVMLPRVLPGREPDSPVHNEPREGTATRITARNPGPGHPPP